MNTDSKREVRVTKKGVRIRLSDGGAVLDKLWIKVEEGQTFLYVEYLCEEKNILLAKANDIEMKSAMPF